VRKKVRAIKTLKPVLLAALLLGCGEDTEEAPAEQPAAEAPPPAAAEPAAAPGAVRRDQRSSGAPAAQAERPPVVDFQESAFVESDRSRDPFRNFANVFVEEARGEVRSQREVVLEQYAIEQLKLVGLVTGMDPPRALLIDPTGVGHMVTRGQYVGRATVVQPSGGVGAAYEVNWRVDRIRDGDVVLVRDDPANPDVPSATRVIPLRTEDISAETASGDGSEPGGSDIKRLRERLAAMEAAEAAQKRAGGAAPNTNSAPSTSAAPKSSAAPERRPENR
jgi:type IV pilus assembly protein PilP